MKEEHNEVVLGQTIPGSLVPDTDDTEQLKSKYLPDVDVRDTYGEAAMMLSPLEREVAVNIAEGMRYNAVAQILDLDSRVVKTIANRRKVKLFIREYVEQTTAMVKAKREMYLAQIIEARLDRIDNMADASELDTATLIDMLDRMGKEREKAKYQKGEQDQMVNILQQLTKGKN